MMVVILWFIVFYSAANWSFC